MKERQAVKKHSVMALSQHMKTIRGQCLRDGPNAFLEGCTRVALLQKTLAEQEHHFTGMKIVPKNRLNSCSIIGYSIAKYPGSA